MTLFFSSGLAFLRHLFSGDSDVDLYEDFKGHLLKAFEKSSVDELDKKDITLFCTYWKQLSALLEHFDDLAAYIRSAGVYVKAEIPDIKEYKALKAAIRKLTPLVEKASEFVIDPDRMRAELLPVLEMVWKEYAGPFAHGVNEINNALSDLHEAIDAGESANELKVLKGLSDALPDAQRAVEKIMVTLEEGEGSLFNELLTGDDLTKLLQKQDWIHTSKGIDLRLKDLSSTASEIAEIARRCREKPSTEFLRVAEFLCDEVLKEKLKAHKDKKVIKDFLSQTDPPMIAKYLLSLKESTMDEFVKILKAVLTGLKFVTVRLVEFKPTHTTLWSDTEVNKTVDEFEEFLKRKAKGNILKIE